MKAVVVLTVLALAGLGLAAVPAAAGDLKVGDQAPNFKLQATDGKTYQLTDFKGKESVVLAWFRKRSRRVARSSASRSPSTAT
jgi:peroxiredoxin Q/BCP